VNADVVIMGGGLAGLTLALQLKERCAGLRITVLERARHPVPRATHKVGESSVEIGAHYFDSVLGLDEHLEAHQLRKFGFRFFFSDRRADVDHVLEAGLSSHFPVATYQLDRGIFENFLAERARARGVEFLDRAVVRGFTLARADAADAAAGDHEVRYERDGTDRSLRGRWLIDASGRAALIKRELGLTERSAHDANGVWFRIGGRIAIDEWSSDRAWLARCVRGERWLSTNHLVGEGYWVWLIPLSSGVHSVGIVADARVHPLKEMNTFARALRWLGVHQPRLARELDARRAELMDFRFLRGFSYGCKQVFSGARWALTGEAGVFLDPFYSPGSDFIAIANTYITELVAKDRAGEPIAPYARLYEQFFFSFYRSTLSLYVDQYPIFGDPEVLPVKAIWDYTYYWGILCQLFFQRRIADVPMMARLRPQLLACQALNEAMQPFLREWSRVSGKRNLDAMFDQSALAWFVELNRSLKDRLDERAFLARIHENCALMHGLAADIVARAQREHSSLSGEAIRALLEKLAQSPGELPRVCAVPQTLPRFALAG